MNVVVKNVSIEVPQLVPYVFTKYAIDLPNNVSWTRSYSVQNIWLSVDTLRLWSKSICVCVCGMKGSHVHYNPQPHTSDIPTFYFICGLMIHGRVRPHF